jgi:hypothetical protein
VQTISWGKSHGHPDDPDGTKNIRPSSRNPVFPRLPSVNLLQRRYSKTRLDRMLTKEESVLNFLGETHNYLGKLEHACTFELHGASSPQEVGKAIHVTRNKIESTMADMVEHLRSFRQYRRKEKAQEKQKKLTGAGQAKK